ncbi:MAG: nucleotidyltransferase [Clostridia bacterium]
MKVLGIIAEYNPFHKGHEYHIQKSKEITGADFVIVIMSGSFTQAGNISIYDKFTRAKVATNYGADLVIELPTIYATSSAEYFAKGAVNILDKLGVVDCICFGSESADIQKIKEISNIILTNEKNIWKDISLNFKNGVSFAFARKAALSSYLDSNQIDTIESPNNILGLEYVKAITMLKSSIMPFCIKRESSNFNEIKLDTRASFTSATSIRNEIYNFAIEKNRIPNTENIEILKNYLPTLMFKVIQQDSPLFNELYFSILKYNILNLGMDNLKTIQGITEGLENRIYSCINTSKTYSQFIQNIKSKRYQMSKIKRVLISILLNISKDYFENMTNKNLAYAHILASNENGKKLLSMISKNSNIPVISSINDKVLNSLNEDIKSSIKLDILSANIHSILKCDEINKDYTNKL